ncbi:MAG: hypothetical protein IJ491_06290 [Clostridia bacterium]|nr:hypothetical protein [Clostridia bacterium]
MKKQIKKGLSLMLAVLMVLSCWVWVAPTKAEAASAGSYKVTVTVNVTDTWKNGGSNFSVDVTHKSNNGTGDTESTTGAQFAAENLFNSVGGNKKVYEETVSGFPTKIHIWASVAVGRNCTFDTVTITVNGVVVSHDLTGSYKIEGDTFSAGEYNLYATIAADDYPVPSNITGLDGIAELEIPEIGSTAVNNTGTLTGTVVDQYGTSWYAAPSYYLSQSSEAPVDIGGEDGGFWLENSGDGAIVKVNQQMQVAFPVKDDPATAIPETERNFYLVANYKENNANVTAFKIIKVVYPTYKWVFNSDYIVGSNPTSSIMLSDGTKETYGTYSKEYAYGQALSVYPTGEATRDGHLFLGFWTVPQESVPTQGKDDSPWAQEASFARPVSSEAYAMLDDEAKKLAFDAGEQYVAGSKAPATEGNKTYYAWWLSEDVSVKFYDVDGSFLDSFDLKYGQVNSAITWPTPTESYSNGALTYSNWDGRWVDINGDIVDSAGYTFKHDLILTPKYEDVKADYEYKVYFYKIYGNYNATYAYRATPTVYGAADVGEYGTDTAYTYTFEGWTTTPSAVEGTNGNAVIMIEDGNFDANGNAVYLVEDFTVRADAKYYPVFRRHLRSYDVTFKYKNNQGEDVTETVTYKYGEQITPPAAVPAEYATGGAEYTLLGWNKGSTELENFYNEKCEGAAQTYVARYSAGVPTAYDVVFKYYDNDGKEQTISTEVKHGNYITEETVNSLPVYEAYAYDNGEEYVKILGVWEYDGVEYTAEELLDFSPVNHVTFNAVYGEGKPYYTVTYVDGAATESHRIVSGTKLPAWNVEAKDESGAVVGTEEYIPSREKTLEGEYTFLGWYDEEQLDISATNGNKYVPISAGEDAATAITGDVTLYPQFEYSLFEYTVTFKDWNGNKISLEAFENEDGEIALNYGDSLADIQAAAEAAAAVRPADEVYTYTFLGWDKKVPATCQGTDLEFVAQYKSIYNYYDVEWYNGKDESGNLIGDKDGKPLATSHYVYGEKLHTPSVTLDIPESEVDGEVNVFAGWYYLDANGDEQIFSRGLALTTDILTDGVVKMYAKYKAAPKQYTVTVVTAEATQDAAEVSYEVVVEENATLNISEPASGWASDTTHKEFTKWTLADGDEFTLDTPITEDITIYANYAIDEHEYTLSEVITAPTYPEGAFYDYDGTEVPASTGAGEKAEWCACSREKTERTAEIDPLMDNVIPSGTTYVGTTRWDTYDDAAANDAADVSVYAGPKTDLIITTSDKGGSTTCQCDGSGELCYYCQHDADFNPTGKGSGVTAIYTYTEKASVAVDVADSLIWVRQVYDWTTIRGDLIGYYKGWDNIPLMYKEYNANVTGKAGNLNLVDGEVYITYFKLVDKLGNISYMRTGKYKYDALAPELTLTGDSNYKGNKFCKEVTVTVTELNPVTVTVNGEAATLTDGVLKITEAGLYQIVAADKAGNKTTVSVEVLADHETRVNNVEATCTSGGYNSEICNICNKQIGTSGATEALGHKLVETTVEATCVENGYILVTCERCDEVNEKKLYKTDDNGAETTEYLYPALGHDYKYAEDSDPTTWTVATAATCSAKGKAVNPCERCGSVIEAELPENDNHNFYNPVTVKPTCTEGGQKTQTCRLCKHTETLETYEAKGHTVAKDGDTVLYKVITKATCAAAGSQVSYCSVCKAEIGDPVEIPRTNDHKWIVDEDETVEPTVDESGEIWYKCAKDGCDATYGPVAVDKIQQYTVTFIGTVLETVTDGTSGEETVVEKTYEKKFELTEGSTITAEDLAEQVKLDKADGTSEYIFAGWYNEAQTSYDATNGTKYSLPMNVSEDITLYAQFTESEIIYKVKFAVPTTYDAATGFGGYEEVKTLMGAIGTKRTPAETPSFDETSTYSFEFKGWEKAGVVYDTVTVEGDYTYRAKFEATQKEYDVVFMNGTEGLTKVTVKAGGTAVYTGETPTKAYDGENHYTFSGWDKALTNITAKTTVYAQYTTIPHTVDYDNGTVIQEASCTQAEITKYGCTACDYTEEKETAPKLTHDPETTYNEETGKNVTTCKRCKAELSSVDASFTIKFENWNGNRLGTETVKVNAEVNYTGKTPERDSTDQYSYTFKGWVVAGDENNADATVYASDGLPNATANVTYVAVFNEIDRVYKVQFATTENVVIKAFTGVKYGEAVEFSYDEFVALAKSKYNLEKADFEPASDSKGHYEFSEWDTATDEITGDTYVRPVYVQATHTYSDSMTGATCTEAGGVKHSCDCGYYYIDGNVPAKGHAWVVSQVIAPDYTTQTNGKRIYICTNGCGETKEEEISGQLTEITVTVKDSDGNPVNNALVRLYVKDTEGNYVDTGLNDRTKADGIVVFYVQPGEYRAYISVDGMGDATYDITVDEKGNTTGNGGEVIIQKPVVDTSCSCSCHRDNFWGAFFRFFQKIIKLFTGEPSCCADPDSRI